MKQTQICNSISMNTHCDIMHSKASSSLNGWRNIFPPKTNKALIVPYDTLALRQATDVRREHHPVSLALCALNLLL